MEPFVFRFGTPQAVKFREAGCEEEFSVRARGEAVVSDYDRAKYGDGTDLAPFMRQAASLLGTCLAGWSGQELLKFSQKALAEQMEKALAAEGVEAKVTIQSIALTEESDKRYQEIFTDRIAAYHEALLPKASLEGLTDEPHGPLMQFDYSYSSHGMAFGTSSYGGDTVYWKEDGSVTLSNSQTGGGKYSQTVWRVLPEAAEKLRAFVKEKHLAALAKKPLPDFAMGVDNVTTTSIRMEFDDRPVGGTRSNTLNIQCGMAGFYYRDLEKVISALIKECKETGEVLSNVITENQPNFFSMNPMVQAMLNNQHQVSSPTEYVDGPQMRAGALGENGGAAKASADGWTCRCGNRNTGRFCTECGSRRPE